MKTDSNERSKFAVCISNKGYEASLEVGKLYRVISDNDASSHGYIRAIDESGEDYGYSKSRFFPMEIPEALDNAFQSHTSRRLVTGDPTRVS
jgi:hypothetical protein